MKMNAIRIIAIVVAAVSLVSGCECAKPGPDEIMYERVMIMYSAGFNSLSGYLQENIKDLQKGFVPDKRGLDVMLLVSHQTKVSNGYSNPAEPVLIRMYKTRKSGVVMDTLARYSSDFVITRAAEMKDILQTINKQFPAKHYGMVFSSHASGWVPKGYFSHPESYERKSSGGKSLAAPHLHLPEGAVPYVEPEEYPGAPPVKSLGITNAIVDGTSIAYEIDLPEFASSIPMPLDYLILDACLAGGIEVAYQLKDVCGTILFSPTEVLAEGLDYKNLASHLIGSRTDVVAVADDYYQRFAKKSSQAERSATVSVIDCTKLDAVAECSKSLFEKYRNEIASVIPSRVQRYYRSDKHWFYDFEDIMVQAGISASDKKQFESILNSCIMYKAATEWFLQGSGGFKIDTFSGLSMYLPCNGSAYLNNFYKTLEWNKAAELVD